MITDDIGQARALLEQASRVFVLTGAGISTAAGIPDFRGPQGLWTLDPKAELVSDLEHYLHDDEVREAAWERRAHQAVWTARPTRAHQALATFEGTGRLVGIATQNTDGLHQAAGTSEHLVHEVHGNARLVRCEECGHEQPMAEVIARVQAGDPDPRCLHLAIGSPEPDPNGETCGGILRATVILFGELLDTEVIEACVEAAEQCDLLVAIGTTLTVQPVAGLLPYAIGAGAKALIINNAETEYDDLAHVSLRADTEVAVPALFSPPG